MTVHDRVMRVVKQLQKEVRIKRIQRFNQDDLISYLYVEAAEYINRNPLAENSEIHEKIDKLARGYIRQQRYRRKLIHSRQRKTLKQVPRTESNPMKIWCDTRESRLGMKLQSRLLAYLHYVEQFPIEELSEIFGRTKQAINSAIKWVKLKKGNPMYAKDDVVMLVMDNPYFHRMLAWVKEPTEWGAIVEVESHNYPERQRWELRATNDEMVYIGTLPPVTPVEHKVKPDGGKAIVSNAQAMLKPVTYLPGCGYTSDECTTCGRMTMRRNGTCLVCDTCGTTTGC